MNPLNYWPRLIKLVHHYRKKSPSLPYLPVRLWVELTSYCNYKCIMCPNKDLRKEDRGFMDFDLYKNIVDESKDFVFEINLAHRGESLMHPQLIEAISYAKKNRIFTRLHTNGSLLSEEVSHKIIRSKLDRLSFSFDGYDRETYEKIRIGGNFDKTLENIVRFLQIKKKTRSKKPITVIEVINFNQKDKQEYLKAKKSFHDQFKNLPLNNIVFREMHNWAGQIEKERQGKNYTVCPFPWNALVIYWDGAVLPCTQDFFGDFVVGNMKDSSLLEIWNGENMRYLRKKLAERSIAELKACSNCDRVWREGIFGVPKEYLWKFITKRMP
ncbi:MAG: SPASM domain-containing protein [Candidatus Aminicenantes bacterium]|nr:MAG: SPASM domain-containing protein [Candidatus Aminicenantes bacterium]